MLDQKYSHIVNDGEDITIYRIPRTTNYTGKATIARFKGSYTDYAVQNRRMINTLLESNLTTGELVEVADEFYLCVVSKKEIVQGQEVSIIAHGLSCNATLTVTRTETTYDDDGNPTGETTELLIDLMPCRADHVTYRMRQEDPGLLPGTVLKVYAMNVPSLVLLDKAMVEGTIYRVDDINRLEIPGAMVLQLSVYMDEGIEG